MGHFYKNWKKIVFISITKENKYNVSIEWSRPPSIKGQITYNLNRKTYKLISKFRLGELKVIKKLTQINEFLKYGFINKWCTMYTYKPMQSLAISLSKTMFVYWLGEVSQIVRWLKKYLLWLDRLTWYL